MMTNRELDGLESRVRFDYIVSFEFQYQSEQFSGVVSVFDHENCPTHELLPPCSLSFARFVRDGLANKVEYIARIS